MSKVNDKYDELLLKYGFERLLHSRSEEYINDIESNLNTEFQDDYKYYVTHYNSYDGFIGNEYLQLWKVDDLLKLNTGYGIINLLGIGSNGAGEFIGMETDRVILCPFIDADSSNYIEIGLSFSDMLLRLFDGKGWFE